MVNGISILILAARFCARPSFAKPLHESCPNKIRGAERRQARSPDPQPALRMSAPEPAAGAARATNVSRYRGHPLAGALAFRRSVAALAKTSRPRLSPVPRFMVADNRSAPRAASSWQTGVVAGRASFRTARVRSAKPHAGTAPAPSIGTPPVDAPDERACVFSSSQGPNSRNSAG